MKDFAQQAHDLITEQTRSWELLRRNREALANVRCRGFDFGKFVVNVYFNPARLTSSLAKVDEQSIRNRKCFLCDENRPVEQKSIDAGHGFKLICNPFPVLSEHFTLVREHSPQRIGPYFAAMLELARALGKRYTTFYNGPQSGASAPDHMHFQAGTKNIMPIDIEYERIKRPAGEAEGLKVFIGENYLRRFIGLESDDAGALEAGFARLHDAFQRLAPQNVEPMMNVLCSHDVGSWRVVLFPRIKHRPSFYFADDHTRMLLSPGTVDVGGMVTAVRQEDFEGVTKAHLTQMFEEITVAPQTLERLIRAVGMTNDQTRMPIE